MSNFKKKSSVPVDSDVRTINNELLEIGGVLRTSQTPPSNGVPLSYVDAQDAAIVASGHSELVSASGSLKSYTDAQVSGVTVTGIDGNDRLTYFGIGTGGNTIIDSSWSNNSNVNDDYYFTNLKIISGGQLILAGRKLFVAGTLDLTVAPSGAIVCGPTNAGALPSGGNAIGNTGGAAPASPPTAQTLGVGAPGASGRTGTTGVGQAGSSSGGASNAMGGSGGSCGKGGNGGSGAGGAVTNGTGDTFGSAGLGNGGFGVICKPDTNLVRFSTSIGFYNGGQPGIGGASGAGDGTNTGGGGGGGGNGGSVMMISAKTIAKSASTPSGVITCFGGDGGNGGTPAAGNCGGGGGGGGGAGGFVEIIYENLIGPTVTGIIIARGGKGGNGGNATGSGIGGDGGRGGGGGQILAFNLTSGTRLLDNGQTQQGAAGGAGVSITGGSGTLGKVAFITF